MANSVSTNTIEGDRVASKDLVSAIRQPEKGIIVDGQPQFTKKDKGKGKKVAFAPEVEYEPSEVDYERESFKLNNKSEASVTAKNKPGHARTSNTVTKQPTAVLSAGPENRMLKLARKKFCIRQASRGNFVIQQVGEGRGAASEDIIGEPPLKRFSVRSIKCGKTVLQLFADRQGELQLIDEMEIPSCNGNAASLEDLCRRQYDSDKARASE